MDLISVIIPVYNVEKYLDRCIQSVVGQTYKNLEIILVDDGSPDNCPAMCDEWAKRDSRIKVIHKENGGLSDARNVGIAVATGSFIGFVDSDDYISADMYQLLYDRMLTDDCDISVCGIQLIFEDSTAPRSLTCSGNCILDNIEAMRAIICESWIKQPVVYKLYKTHMVRDILFPVGKCNEDVFWSYQPISRAKKVSIFDTHCYFYTQRSGSIMNTNYSLKRLDALIAKQERLALVEKSYPSLVDDARHDLLFSCMYAMQMSLRYMDASSLKTARKNIQKIALPLIPSIQPRNSKEKIWLNLARISFVNTCKLRNFLKIGL